MDVISLIVSIIGTLITIGSTIYAYILAQKAKKSASEAESLKKSIEREYKKIELGKLLNAITTEIKNTRLLTSPANPDKKVRGVNYDTNISSLRVFVDYLKENCHYLPDEKEKQCIIEYKKVEDYISEFVNERDQIKRFEIGDKIHKCVGELLRIVKPETDIS